MADTGNELDEILSAEPAPAVTTGAETTAAAPTTEAGQGRDEQGRYAPKAGDTPAATVTTEQQPAPTTEVQPGAMVPQQALHAARQENADLKRRMEILERSMLAQPRQQQTPAPEQKKPEPKDIFQDPSGFTRDVVTEALTPVQDQVRQVVFTYSKREAVRDHGAETVGAAEAALKAAIEGGTVNAQNVREQLTASLDPVGDVVRWHKKQSAITRVGDDPDKWLEAELEKRLADPAQQAKILERIQAGAVANTNANRSSPATKLPPSLHALPGGTNAATELDGSDGAIFAHATAGMR